MTFSLIGSAKGEGTGPNATSSGFDTTGADLIVVSIGYGYGTAALSDNKSNTWTALTASPANANNGIARLWYCVNPTVGSDHTFTASSGYPSITVAAFSGVDTADAFEAQNAATGAASISGNPGSITPVNDGALIVFSGMSGGDGTYVASVSVGTLLQATTGTSGTDYPTSISWYEQATAAEINPTLTADRVNSWSAAIVAFNAAAGGADTLVAASVTAAATTSAGLITQITPSAVVSTEANTVAGLTTQIAMAAERDVVASAYAQLAGVAPPQHMSPLALLNF